MQYMLTIYHEEAGWDRLTPEQQAEGMAAYQAYSEALAAAGALVATGRLQPVATATTVRIEGEETRVLDGPYAETKEQLGGYYIFDRANFDEAIEYAARIPSAAYGSIEIRPVMVFE